MAQGERFPSRCGSWVAVVVPWPGGRFAVQRQHVATGRAVGVVFTYATRTEAWMAARRLVAV